MRRGRKDDFAFLADEAEVREWEANQEELDRQWYDADEEGYGRFGEVDDYYQNDQQRQQAEDLALQKKRLQQPVSRRTMNSADHDKWELNRMLIGGAVKMGD